MSSPTLAPTTVTTDDAKFQSALLTALIPFLFLCCCFLCIRGRIPQVYLPNKLKEEEEKQNGDKSKNAPDAALIPNGGGDQSGGDGYNKPVSAVGGGVQALGSSVASVFSLTDIIKTIWSLDMEEIEDIAGFDAMTFSLMLWFQFLVMAFCVPLAFVLLVPLYATDDNKDTGVTLDYMTLSNVSNGDPRMWGTILIAAIMYIGCVEMLKRAFKMLSERADLFNSRPTEAHYTVLLENIEPKYLDPQTGEQQLRAFLDRVFPGGVVNLEMCKDVSGINKSYNAYVKAKTKVEQAEKSESGSVGCCCFKKTLEEAREDEAEASDIFFENRYQELQTCDAAIIQFDQMRKAAICKSSKLTGDGMMMTVRAVPSYPDEVLWENLAVAQKRKTAGESVGLAAYLLLIILCAPPLVTIQGLANLDDLANTYNLQWIQDLPAWFRALIQGSAPAILFAIFFALLPYVISFLTTLAKLPFKTDNNKLSLARYTDCLIGLGLLLTVVASGLFGNINELSNLSASQIWEAFGSTLPSQSVFYINYVVTAAFLNLGKEMILLIPLVKYYLGIWSHDVFNYYTKYAIAIMMFVICTTFAVISPFILIWGALYFLISYMVFTYQLVYCYKKGQDSGGQMFPTVFSKLMGGMLIGQVVVIAMFVLKEAVVQAALFLLVPIYTLVVRSNSLKNYGIYFQLSSLESMQERDDEMRGNPVIKPGGNTFCAPAILALRGGADAEDPRQIE